MKKELAESLIENLISAATDVGRTFNRPSSDQERKAAFTRLNYNESKLYRKISEMEGKMAQFPKVKMYQLTQKEKEMIIIGLNMRRAYIETGDSCLTAVDAVNIGKPEMVKPLSIDQMKLIVATDELVQKLYR